MGFAARLFLALKRTENPPNRPVKAAQSDIETRLADVEPDVEVLLCERVTGHLDDLLRDVGLEVSSPGPQRPLTKPEHFRRYVGRRARLRTREPRDGYKSFTGELVDASEEAVTVAADQGIVSILYAEINRGNLVAERG